MKKQYGKIMNTNDKYEKLKEIIKNYGSVSVAFSGGVDSSFLLKVAHDVLGNGLLAITVDSPLQPERETGEAIAFCNSFGIRQKMISVDVFEIEGFEQNPTNRCYICKKNIFGRIIETSEMEGIDVIVEGSNTDDDNDYRPGMQAIRELGIKSPLREAGLSKQEIRSLSKELSLATWEKPSFACLATRFVYGDTITEEKLKMIDLAEQFLINLGFSQLRVRVHGENGKQARIETLPQDFPILIEEDNRSKVYDYFREIGFENISLDLRGYKSGSMNEGIEK